MKTFKYSELKQVRIVALEEIARDVFVLSFEKIYNFSAGQVIALSLEADDPSARLYSVCSGINEDLMSILFNIIPQGKITGKLSKLKPCDYIYCSQPFGSFLGNIEPGYWIASGTGIAPYLSMFRSGLGANKVLIHGGRKLDSFYFLDSLEEYFKEHYIRCCSTEKGKGVFSGRLTTYLKQKDELPSDYRYYLCGSSEMVVETRDILISKGIPFNNIMSEIYF